MNKKFLLLEHRDRLHIMERKEQKSDSVTINYFLRMKQFSEIFAGYRVISAHKHLKSGEAICFFNSPISLMQCILYIYLQKCLFLERSQRRRRRFSLFSRHIKSVCAARGVLWCKRRHFHTYIIREELCAQATAEIVHNTHICMLTYIYLCMCPHQHQRVLAAHRSANLVRAAADNTRR